MEFQNEFDVDAPIDEVWKAMLDLERVAPAMPGAEVLEKVDDDNYKVAIKVKVGPVSMQYRGDVQFTDKDEANHAATMNVKAREARGQGQATAKVAMNLSEPGGDKTHGEMKADVQLSGKAASMGRGIIQDVSARLVDQFANNLATMLAGPKPEPAAAESSAPAEPEKDSDKDAGSSNGAGAADREQLSTQETVEQPAVTASGASASSGGGGSAGAAAAATQMAAEAKSSDAPSSSSEAATPKPASPPKPAPAPAAELDAGALAVSMAKDRLKNPVVIGVLVALVLAFLFGRRR